MSALPTVSHIPIPRCPGDAEAKADDAGAQWELGLTSINEIWTLAYYDDQFSSHKVLHAHYTSISFSQVPHKPDVKREVIPCEKRLSEHILYS